MRQTVYAEHHQLISQREVCLVPGLSTRWEAWDIGKLWRVEVVVTLHGQAEAHDGEPGRDGRVCSAVLTVGARSSVEGIKNKLYQTLAELVLGNAGHRW